ncbi:MAG: CARDB domain-containing protein [Chloroflexota bacterium]
MAISMKMRSLVGLFVTVAMLVSLVLSAAPAFAAPGPPTGGVNLRIDPANTGVEPGQTFQVAINVDSDSPVRGAQVDLAFDPALIRVNSVSEGTYFSDFGQATYFVAGTIDNILGKVTGMGVSIMGGTGGQTGNGPFVVVNCTALAGGTSLLTLSNNVLFDPAFATIPGVNLVGGTVNIGVPDLVVTSKYETMVPGDASKFNVTYTVKNQGSQTAAASQTGIKVGGVLQSTLYACPSLVPGASDTQTVGPFTISGGAVEVVVIADQPNAVVESNETNNERANTYALASDQGKTTDVTASFDRVILLTPPEDIVDWKLVLGQNTRRTPTDLNVKCNTNWQVDVQDVHPRTGGYMAPWDGTTFVAGDILENPLRIQNDGLAVQSLADGRLVFATGTPASQVDNDGQDIVVKFRQLLVYGDPILPGGQSYHLQVTWYGFVTF